MKTAVKWIFVLAVFGALFYLYAWPRPIEVSQEQVPAKGGQDCSACKGSGAIEDPQKCTNCKGTGHTEWSLKGVTSRTTKPLCPSCAGTGSIMQYAPCEACEGTGGFATLTHIREGLSYFEQGLRKIGLEPAANPRPQRRLRPHDFPLIVKYVEMSGDMAVTRWSAARKEAGKWVVVIHVSGSRDGKPWSQSRRIHIQNREIVASERVQ